MALIEIKNLSFSYPDEEKDVLRNISLTINEGEFIVICGPSGCGKTTLLKHIKKEIRPEGNLRGQILYKGKELNELNKEQTTEEIGMVFQEPESQIVMDSVCHELAFSMENMGYSVQTMRKRIAEMSNFFGLEKQLNKSIHELSGGQKQILNLASVLLLHPKVLLLDEPTSQLDPVASKEFLQMVYRLNREFSITVILSEHRLEEVFPMADKVVFMEEGEIKYNNNPRSVIKNIYNSSNEGLVHYIPSISRLYFALEGEKANIPLTVREGRNWFENIEVSEPIKEEKISVKQKKCIMNIKNVCFKYEMEAPYVLKKVFLEVYKGEFLAILGGNGTGKSTLLQVMAGVRKPQRGEIYFNKKKLYKMKEKERYSNIGYLAQNPLLYFLYESVEEEIYERANKFNVDKEEVEKLINIFGIENILKKHPYDISGGEKQKVALIIVLLSKPSMLLLDEPTKGLDPISKLNMEKLISDLRDKGITIVMSTHDIEFTSKNANRCTMLFDGNIASEGEPSSFFSENYFYTTTINRIVRNKLPKAIMWEDVLNYGCFKKVY